MMKISLGLAIFLSFMNSLQVLSQEQKWVRGKEVYFILPLPQTIDNPQNEKTVLIKPYGFGISTTAIEWAKMSTVAGMQFQRMSINDKNFSDVTAFSTFDMIVGLRYMSHRSKDGDFHYTFSMLADFGMESENYGFFFVPILSASMIYQIEEYFDSPSGLAITFFYRPTEIDFKYIRLQSGFGLKIGYMFGGLLERIE